MTNKQDPERKDLVRRKNLYGTKESVDIFDIQYYLLKTEIDLSEDHHLHEGHDLLKNSSNFVERMKGLSLFEARKGIYLSPLKGISHANHWLYIFKEREIEGVFDFMLKSLLPLFKFKEEYIAMIILDIFKTDWKEEDDEAYYAKGEYYLRNYFMNNSLAQYMRNRSFSLKFINFLYERLNWHNHAYSYRGSHTNKLLLSEKDWRKIHPYVDSSRKFIPAKETLENLIEKEKNKSENLFKNVQLISNLKGALLGSDRFEDEDKFEGSLN
tara:strand:+ start:999 stop:1805 length:807 start_codon:yes stop_codon:yes gene_type:complete